MEKKILVTGGLGYIGSHTVVELVKKGYEPILMDDLSNSQIGILDRIEQIVGIKVTFHQVDLTDNEALIQVLDRYPSVDAVIHFAASKAVGESVLQPLKYYRNNLISLLNLLGFFKDRGRSLKFVFSSSCTVYGEPDRLPVTENNEVKKASSPYGNTKQIAEEILSETARSAKDAQVISLRYFNPVGAHSSGLIGELPLGVPQNLVPFITQTEIGKRDRLTVFGNDYETPDGTCIRDYIHVVDLAKAHIAAVQLLEGDGLEDPYEVFNIGTGRGYSVLEVIQEFEKTSGKPLNYQIGPRREGDTSQIWGDIEKSNSKLGWCAELGLDVMMQSAWEWEKNLSKQSL